MIHYDSSCGIHYILKIFQWRGSVFPKALRVALPCALLTAGLKTAFDQDLMYDFLRVNEVLSDSGGWSGFSFLVGFLIVFRTSQAYSRFWDGCIYTHHMCAEWFDACSSLCAFCVHSQASDETTADFKHLLVRLFSMLHALALAEIEDTSKEDFDKVYAFQLELIDVRGIDPHTLMRIKESDCKVELVFTWIQQLIVANIATGVMAIPAPILSRSFQELSNGMVAFHQAMKITLIPFPFPYAQTCDCLLIMHWMVVPLIVAQWTNHALWAGIFAFIQVFILWTLNFIAVEIENPFGRDENDLDVSHMQRELNKQLAMLTTLGRSNNPSLMPSALRNIQELEHEDTKTQSTFACVWTEMYGENEAAPTRAATTKRREGKAGASFLVKGSQRPALRSPEHGSKEIFRSPTRTTSLTSRLPTPDLCQLRWTREQSDCDAHASANGVELHKQPCPSASKQYLAMDGFAGAVATSDLGGTELKQDSHHAMDSKVSSPPQLYEVMPDSHVPIVPPVVLGIESDLYMGKLESETAQGNITRSTATTSVGATVRGRDSENRLLLPPSSSSRSDERTDRTVATDRWERQKSPVGFPGLGPKVPGQHQAAWCQGPCVDT